MLGITRRMFAVFGAGFGECIGVIGADLEDIAYHAEGGADGFFANPLLRCRSVH